MSQNKPSILLVEDDVNFGLMLKAFLEMNGFDISLCQDGEAALNALKKERFAIGIFDIMMPIMDGYSLAEEVIKSYPNLPFIFLTAKTLKEDQITGYKLGARDYLIKPFDPEILLLKIQVILKNESGNNSSTESFKIGNYEFDASKRLLTLADNTVKLSPKESSLLKLLCQKQGELLSHSEAMNKVWKNDDYFTKQSLNVFISKLRKYLSEDSAHTIEIKNLHSSGFVLEVEPT